MASRSPANTAFVARWIVGEIPASSYGARFLWRLFETEPRLFEWAERVGFNDPTDLELREHPLWLGFVRHYPSCDDCNEG